MDQQVIEEGSHTSSASKKVVSFSNVVEEFYFDDLTDLTYQDDTEMDLTELSSVEPMAYDFGDGLQAFTDLSDYHNYCEESSVSEESSSLENSGVIQQVMLDNANQDDNNSDDESLEKRHDEPEPTGFFMNCFNSFILLTLCTRCMQMAGNWFGTPSSPIDEDDVVAAIVVANSGGKLAALGALGGGSGVVIP